MKQKPTLFSLFTFLLAGILTAATLTVDEAGTANSFGRTSGIAIDYNTSTSDAVWDTNLVDGQEYSVDSVSLYLNSWTADTDSYYLGVYTDITTDAVGGGQDDTLSGFLGTSTNALNLSALDGGSKDLVTWNFSGINVTADDTAGSGSGILYFILQTGTSALSTTGPRPGQGEQSFHRIDGTSATFSDFLSATIESSFNGNDNFSDIVAIRPLEYQTTVTAIPEPSSLLLVTSVIGAWLCIRSRKKA